MNQIVIVGRLVSDPEVVETEDGKKVSNITVAVSRSYKNAEGVYETDFVDCTLWNSIAESTTNYCKKGDILGIKGRLQTDTYEKDGEKRKVQRVIADKISFLSSSKTKEDENEKESMTEKIETSKEAPEVEAKQEVKMTKKSKKQLEPEMA